MITKEKLSELINQKVIDVDNEVKRKDRLYYVVEREGTLPEIRYINIFKLAWLMSGKNYNDALKVVGVKND